MDDPGCYKRVNGTKKKNQCSHWVNVTFLEPKKKASMAFRCKKLHEAFFPCICRGSCLLPHPFRKRREARHARSPGLMYRSVRGVSMCCTSVLRCVLLASARNSKLKESTLNSGEHSESCAFRGGMERWSSPKLTPLLILAVIEVFGFWFQQQVTCPPIASQDYKKAREATARNERWKWNVVICRD